MQLHITVWLVGAVWAWQGIAAAAPNDPVPPGTTPAGAESIRPDNAPLPPGAAASRAAAVVRSLDSLTAATNDLLQRIAELGQQRTEAIAKRNELRDRRDREMADYRAGLFCSGCNRTKTDILAKGEKFPHEGQTIVRPTPEQIDAKARELQAPIDQLDTEILRLENELTRRLDERQEALWQITEGFDLWHTCAFYERVLRERAEDLAQTAYLDRRETLEKNIGELRIVNVPSLPKEQQARLDAEIAKLQRQIETEKADRERSYQKYLQAKTAAAAESARQAEQLNAAVNRGWLAHALTLMANPAASSAAGLGGRSYRMGDFTLSRHDEELPEIVRLLTQFATLPTTAVAKAIQSGPTPPTSERNGPNQNVLNDLLHESLPAPAAKSPVTGGKNP